MRKLHSFILVAFCSSLFSISFAQVDSTKSLLWEMSGNGMKKPSYIYGTIHIISKSDFFISEKVSKKLKKADELVMELKLDKETMQQQVSTMLISEGIRLDSVIGEDNYKRFEHFVTDSVNIPVLFFNHLKPIYAQQILTGMMLGKDISSYELSFTDSFTKAHKPIEGLETIEFQMNLLNAIPYSEQTKMLMDYVDHYAASKVSLIKLINEYKDEDLEALHISSIEDDPEMETSLIITRNKAWVPQIKKNGGHSFSLYCRGCSSSRW